MAAPHRLAFFLAMLVLVTSGLWWAVLQFERLSGAFGLGYELPPTVVHASLMVFGFMPLFFAGFLFTAGPKWLGVQAPAARDIALPLALMAGGWLAWPFASHASAAAAMAALVLPIAGMAWMTWRFGRLISASREPDRLHAKAIVTGLAVGCASLCGVLASVFADAPLFARTFAYTGLWGFITVVFVSVAHRMIPFFTSSALPMVRAWRPFWVLWLLLGLAGFEAVATWLELFTGGPAWHGVRGAMEVTVGGVVIWLAFAWGLVQSLKVRLVAMLHLGFSWLGVGLVLSGASHLVQALTGQAWLALGGLHAVTMGCLGSLMMAMVTRVSCGHGGRPLVADDPVWALFWLLQAATTLRIAAAVPTGAAPVLTLAAALLWAGVLAVWGFRYGSWYGRARTDGRAG
ncbi:short-chain dehydrogenase [Ramlibacter tataouinensis]|uniref:Short-chain dehydrogenase n=1 Tax=Ramlibacter tataouinensis TaxID=94132 RepID=A0A140HL83_9BURK|nr:short-chain dehydrogenase [Ramlibacter tataouinensis]